MERIIYENININLEEQSFIEKYNFVLRDTRLVKGHYLPSHWHDYFELEIVLGGNINHIYNNKKEVLVRGDARLLTPFDIHSFDILEEMHLINIRFTNRLLSSEITEMLMNPTTEYSCHFEENELHYLKERTEALCNAKIASPYYKYIASSIISEIVLLLLQKSNPEKESYIMPIHVQKALSYIVKHFKEDITLLSLAKILNITPNYLGAEIKRYIGVTFHDYLNQLRMKYSCDLLLSTDNTISEIAFSCGFNSVAYYATSFKKMLSMTPSEYRQQNQKTKKHKT